MTDKPENWEITDTHFFSSHHTAQRSEIEEIKAGVEEKKKTQGMRRDLLHKVCGWVKITLPALRKILTSVSVKISILL